MISCARCRLRALIAVSQRQRTCTRPHILAAAIKALVTQTTSSPRRQIHTGKRPFSLSTKRLEIGSQVSENADDFRARQHGSDPQAPLSPQVTDRNDRRLLKTNKGRFFVRASKSELDAALLDPNLSKLDEALLSDITPEWNALHDIGRVMYLQDIRYLKLERHYRAQGKHDDADELLQFLFLRYRAQSQSDALDLAPQNDTTAEMDLAIEQDNDDQDVGQDVDEDAHDHVQRAHPLTRLNRFRTFPSTLQLPKSTFTDPLSDMLATISPQHLSRAAHTIFGGDDIPWSAATPRYSKNKEQKPIPLSPFQSEMSSSQANAYMATVAPGVFASVTAALVETRKRLGQAWLRDLMAKPGGPRILDAGGAGVSVLAAREVLRAEWEHMHDTSTQPDASNAVTLASGQTGGAPIDVPTGKATVITANNSLRQRASTMLENTAFIPRLPDHVNIRDEKASQPGKYDLIIAPHTLWDLKEDYLRKQHIANLWSLLHAQGGVLILLEKGLPKAFDTVATARKFLLDRRIAGPGDQLKAADTPAASLLQVQGTSEKEIGMIIAPCTNHVACPMYDRHRSASTKRNCCHFEQRYIRPPFLQKIIGARDKNFEDVKFSYLSVMRGRDLRQEDSAVIQGDQATDRAFAGYEFSSGSLASEHEIEIDPTAPAVPEENPLANVESPHSLTLPRAVLPPLKRTGHVILDLCTPSGKLERWTVPRSFSKQAYRDARKSSWGDLWALGAKTRVNKDNKTSSASEARNAARKRLPRSKAKNIIDVPVDSRGRVAAEGIKVKTGGRMRQGKIKGIRDKRDKKGAEIDD